MKPLDFKEANKILYRPKSMTGDECSSLKVYSDSEQCVSCWGLSWKEKLLALLFGKVWLYVISGKTQPPVALTCERTVFNETTNTSTE